MPNYDYSNPKTGEIITVFQRMKDTHEYTDASGIKWNRVFYVTNAAVDTSEGTGSKEDFMRMTQKKMTVGDMWDVSAKLSEKRTKSRGRDPVKQQAVAAYKKKCGGKLHPIAGE